ncbi:MAG: hypothetical protein NTX61_06365 [Bacteroidetes bacterium]|nr:hypothetical protein [Bacteroidota bacterium]
MKKINIDPEQNEFRYSNWLSTAIDLMKPANLYLYGGRGTAKSTDILAKRIIDVVYDMPGAPFAFIADTYVNLLTNILPHVFLGLNRQQFLEHYHYVVEESPPDHWPKSSIRTFDYKHTITTFNGCKFFLKSLDRPSINAGISVVHQFGDESKYLQKEKLSKFFPTLRGDVIKFGGSHFFLGQSFVSDMPDPNFGESDWMDRMAAKMDKKQIIRILQTAVILNEIKLELLAAEDQKDIKQIALVTQKLSLWTERIKKIRHNSTFFFVVSSLVNADILTLQYFQNLLDGGSFDDFKLHVLSLKRKLDAGSRFYGSLKDRHLFKDGYDYDYYDANGMKANISLTCKSLRYINLNKNLEAGFDAGNMMSLVFGQEQGDIYRVMKNMFTIAPDWIRELANQFLNYFEPMQKKYLLLYHDRAANQYYKVKKDFASQLKHDIEYGPDGKRTGWIVQLMSTGQGNIPHPDKFNLMNILMGEKEKRLPKLLIDQWECKELVNQLEIAPTRQGPRGELQKDKRSDKLPISRLPMESTNLSDAFDYLICRRCWLDIAKQRRNHSLSEIVIR